MKKNIWYPGDIITTEKWNRINNNISLPGAYKLSITVEEVSSESSEEKKLVSTSQNITISKSFNEIINLIKQGIICYFVIETDFGGETELQHNIFIASSFNISNSSIGFQSGEDSQTFYISQLDPTKMVNFINNVAPATPIIA